MSLLKEIQDLAVEPSVELSTLLRKCKILAARLGNPEFKVWVEFELNGYPDELTIPSYRVFPTDEEIKEKLLSKNVYHLKIKNYI